MLITACIKLMSTTARPSLYIIEIDYRDRMMAEQRKLITLMKLIIGDPEELSDH